MKKSSKIWLIAATVFVIIGSLIFVGALASLDFDFAKLGTQEYETNIYEINESFDNISIEVEETKVLFAPSDDQVCRVKCVEDKKVKHFARAENGKLKIETVDNRNWYDYIGIFLENPKMTVYLPQDEYTSLYVETHSGNIEIPYNFSFKSLTVLGNTSDINCCSSVSNGIKITTTTGNIKLDALDAGEIKISTSTGDVDITSVTVNGAVNIDTNTGKAKLTNIACKGLSSESNSGAISLKNVIAKETFNLNNKTGDIRLKNCDADEIFIKTSTGDVTGTILSEKIFITDTSVGKVSVPKTAAGGKCEITTGTGDIEIKIVQ